MGDLPGCPSAEMWVRPVMTRCSRAFSPFCPWFTRKSLLVLFDDACDYSIMRPWDYCGVISLGRKFPSPRNCSAAKGLPRVYSGNGLYSPGDLNSLHQHQQPQPRQGLARLQRKPPDCKWTLLGSLLCLQFQVAESFIACSNPESPLPVQIYSRQNLICMSSMGPMWR